MSYTYIFGPVLSGRLGLSLGLDLLGERVCSLDCVYCEVGATRQLTRERKPWVPARELLAELRRWKDENDQTPDVITLGGLGEPCLNSDMGEIIDGVRTIFPELPVAVLTNSTLMDDPQVRAELAKADRVLPSMDTLVEREFRRINRPEKSLTASALAQGLLQFRREFSGQLYLEVLLSKGYNDSDENLRLLTDYVARLKPDRVDVVTLSRPGTLREATGVDADTLARWRKALGAAQEEKRPLSADKTLSSRAEDPASGAVPPADVQFDPEDERRAEQRMRASLARRPQNVLQLSQALGIAPALVQRILRRLVSVGEVAVHGEGGEAFYDARPSED